MFVDHPFRRACLKEPMFLVGRAPALRSREEDELNVFVESSHCFQPLEKQIL